MHNRITLCGEIEAEPLTRDAGEHQVTGFKVKTWETFKGRRFDSYHLCSAWGDKAEGIRNAVRGQRVFIEGRLKHRSYTPKGSDEKKYITEVDVQSVTLMDATADAPPKTQRVTPAPADNDDIPF